MSDIKKKGALTPTDIDVAAEYGKRKALIDEWWGNFILDTPDKVLNRMFAFAKLRGVEHISYLRRPNAWFRRCQLLCRRLG